MQSLRPSTKFLVVLAIYVLICLAIGTAVPEPIRLLLVASLVLAPFAIVATVYALYLIPIAIHEVGHLLAGRLAGFPFLLLAIGPVLFYRTDQGIKLKRSGIGWFSGFAQNKIPDDKNLRARLAVFIAGGPLASTLFLLFSIWLHKSDVFTAPFPNLDPAFANLADSLSLYLIVAAASALIASLLPISGKNALHDGRLLWWLAKGGEESDRHVALAVIGSQVASGIRPRDWDIALLDKALQLEDGTVAHVLALYNRYLHHADREENVEAAAVLRQARELEPKLHEVYTPLKKAIRFESAFIQAATGNVEESRRISDALTIDDPQSSAWMLKIRTAQAYAEEKFEEGDGLFVRYSEELDRLPKMSHPSYHGMELEWLRKLRSRVANREADPTLSTPDPLTLGSPKS